jgi:hypothetical protein
MMVSFFSLVSPTCYGTLVGLQAKENGWWVLGIEWWDSFYWIQEERFQAVMFWFQCQ